MLSPPQVIFVQVERQGRGMITYGADGRLAHPPETPPAPWVAPSPEKRMAERTPATRRDGDPVPLQAIGTDWIDCYLLHWPGARLAATIVRRAAAVRQDTLVRVLAISTPAVSTSRTSPARMVYDQGSSVKIVGDLSFHIVAS
jgi:hypothetical protein